LIKIDSKDKEGVKSPKKNSERIPSTDSTGSDGKKSKKKGKL
jgi:hypothetical protein